MIQALMYCSPIIAPSVFEALRKNPVSAFYLFEFFLLKTSSKSLTLVKRYYELHERRLFELKSLTIVSTRNLNWNKRFEKRDQLVKETALRKTLVYIC